MFNIYLVHDIKANTFGAPMFFDNNVEALRSLEQATKDTSTQLHKYPSDYNLIHIGQYDKEKGSIVTFDTRSVLANCSSFIE